MYLSENAKEKIRQVLTQLLQRHFEEDLRQVKNEKKIQKQKIADEENIQKTKSELEQIFS